MEKGLQPPDSRLKQAIVILSLLLLALVVPACAGDEPQNVLDPQGPVAEEADQLWDITFLIAVVIFVIVEGLLIFAIVRFRARPGREAAQFHGNTKVEVALTAIPALILAGLAVPTVSTIFNLAEEPANALQIRVVARQFWWEYEYTDLDVKTANELHIPTGQPVFLTLEGADVNHSFWVPKLTGTQDVLPGRVNHMQFTASRPGTYLGQCKEFCGLSHANMRLRVIAHTPTEFQQWVSEQQEPASSPTEELAAEGERILLEEDLPAGGRCTDCHAIAGTDAQGTTGPDLTHFAARETFAGAIFRRTDENLANWLRNPEAVKIGALMPDYGLSEDQIRALVAYLQSLE
jgi:cytochrome c oxidase subunit II